jgi:hypothetical protein
VNGEVNSVNVKRIGMNELVSYAYIVRVDSASGTIIAHVHAQSTYICHGKSTIGSIKQPRYKHAELSHLYLISCTKAS